MTILKHMNSSGKRINESFTGREVTKKVTYLTNYAQQDGYVVMSIV
jgi:hypothetical protein